MSLTGKPQLTTNTPLANDGFWPDLVLAELLSKYRAPAEYADDTIQLGVMLAMINVNEALAAVRLSIEELTYDSLQAYCDANIELVNEEPVLIFRYKHAVFCRAKAFLLQQFNSMNRRPIAENAAKEAPETEQYWLDQSQAAIAALFAKVLPLESVSAQSGVYAALI